MAVVSPLLQVRLLLDTHGITAALTFVKLDAVDLRRASPHLGDRRILVKLEPHAVLDADHCLPLSDVTAVFQKRRWSTRVTEACSVSSQGGRQHKASFVCKVVDKMVEAITRLLPAWLRQVEAVCRWAPRIRQRVACGANKRKVKRLVDEQALTIADCL